MAIQMLRPPAYSVLQGVDRIARQVELDDLVAIFTDNDGRGGLLVYNRQEAPPLPSVVQAQWRAAPLLDLQPEEYARFDGPVVSVAAIDVLLGDIPTHGVHFYPLHDLPFFRRLEAQGAFVKTATRLIETIQERWQRLSTAEQERQRPVFCKRVIQLCLPEALQLHQHPDLVALRFELSDTGCPAVSGRSAYPIFDRLGEPDDIQSLANLGAGGWVAGMRELPLLAPAMQEHRRQLLPLRPALHRFHQAQLQETCRRLAVRCRQVWEKDGQDDMFEAAYVLAAEAWLEGQDAADLVAILPSQDFAKFAAGEEAVAVSRGPVPAISRAENRCSLEDILQNRQRVPAAPVFALPALGPILQQRGANRMFDLGPVFSRAERYADLARTLWLLSRDLLEPPVEEWRQVGASLGEIAEMAQRSALIYGLANPWLWRQGRFSLLVADCHTHLDRCLLQQEHHDYGQAQAHYYAALRAWYGCAWAEDVMGNLVRVAESCRLFILTCEDQGVKREWANELVVAENLETFARNILQPDNVGQMSLDHEALTVAETLRRVANGATPVTLPSSLGVFWLQEYLRSHSHWRDIQASAVVQRPDPIELDRLHEEIARWQRRTFAPQHELHILLTALAEEGAQIRRLQQAVDEGAVIKLFSRTNEIGLAARQTVVIEVQNIGSQPASELNLTLERFAGLDLAPEISFSGPIDLRPGERQRLELKVRAVEPALTLIFGYRFRDHSGRLQTGKEPVYLRARGEVSGLHSRINPFEVGRPVSGKGLFFGRSAEIAQILTRLARGDTHPLVLRGPRRIGKSSLLRRIAALLEQPAEAREVGLAPDLQASLRNLHPVMASLQNMDRTLPRPFEAFLSGLLQDICRKVALDSAPIIAAFMQASSRFGVPRAFVQQIAYILQSRPGERVVMMLDELDDIFQPESREIAKQLRNIIESETHISWLTASTMLIGASAGQYGSPWFNLLEPIELRAMDWPSAFQLMRQLGNRAGFDWSEEAITSILNRSGRRPYLMQLLGARVTDDLNAQGRDRVTSSDVAAAASDLLEEINVTGSYLGFVWNEAGWLGQLILGEVLTAPASLDLTDLKRQVRRRLVSAPGVDLKRFHDAFTERIAWLSDIADTLEFRMPSPPAGDQRQVIGFAIPLVEGWLKQKLDQETGFFAQAVAGALAELKE